jgi:hypothetical protein
MYVRPLSLALVVVLACLAGCGGGRADVGTVGFSCVGGRVNAICLQSCNLGCTSTGCARTTIAQNEIIRLVFSEAIDPASVSTSSIRFRTASGEQPVGELFVNGSQVEFVPTLSISGGQTFFGFAAGETYTMTIPGGDEQTAVVRSTSGKPFERTLTCTLQPTLGIVDLNGVPPSAALVSPSPSQLLSSPRDIDIVVEFNELIDATPFLSGTQSPVGFAVRRTRTGISGAEECDPSSLAVTVTGSLRLDFDASRNVSVLTFRPAAPLPGNVCMEVTVTNGVQDLSGRPAQSQVFQFLTETVPQTAGAVTEEFDDNTFLDIDASAATWAGGTAQFAQIGGDGRHGPFETSLCIDDDMVAGKRQFTLRTDNTIIPQANTTTGAPIAVTDGRFFFTEMVVPADVRLRFVGAVPPVITVAGRLDILGEIDVAGDSLPITPNILTGQPGGLGGVFGGAGGAGGNRCAGFGLTTDCSGVNGGAARVVAGHAYASSTALSGGRGSSVFPGSGLSSQLIYPSPLPSLAYTPSAAAGGGGGGLWTAGAQGIVVANSHNNPAAMGPPADGGAAVQLFPFPAPTGNSRSSLHFLVGGAGGGGAGSHACLALHLVRTWACGGGGGGGGGAIALRAGNLLRIAPSATLKANGGATTGSNGLATSATPAPGGAGSGGSIVLQAGNGVEVSGLVDVRGGVGGTFNRFANGSPNVIPNSASVQIKGGDGAPGFVRLETPGTPTTALLASMQPAPVAQNVAPLVERDDTVSLRSQFYSTGLLFGPDFQRYEIHCTIDGVPTIFSDDPAVSTQPAQPGAALRVMFQAATIDPISGEPVLLRPWRTAVRTVGNQIGIASDGLTSFRFLVILDQTIATTVTIDRISVHYLSST